MTAYRFCRSDDLGLLAEAANRCWRPHFAEEAELTVADLKREIRELDLWTSSCMVAFEGDEPVAVLHACKRDETLVHRIATHPDHLRRGHASHLLTSLSAKLAILGPPRLVAEVPADLAPARALFESCGWVRDDEEMVDLVCEGKGDGGSNPLDDAIVEVTMDDLAAVGTLDQISARAWCRSVRTLRNRAEQLSGLAIVSPERFEAWLLWRGTDEATEIVGMHASDPTTAPILLDRLLRRLSQRMAIWIPCLEPGEVSDRLLQSHRCHERRRHVRYSTLAEPA